MPRMSRRRVWTIVGVAWIVAAAGSVAILVWTGQKLPIRFGPPPAPVRADWLVGSWCRESSNPNVRCVETFADDGQWTLSARGFTPKPPTSAWWMTVGLDDGHCFVLFLEDPRVKSGPMREFVLEGPDTIREESGDQLNHKRYTRVKDAK